MTKSFFLLLSLLFSINLISQEINFKDDKSSEEDLGLYDEDAIEDGYIDPESLADVLTERAENDLDKAEAIFHWITHNIVYNYKLYEEFRSGDRDKIKGKRIRKSEMPEHNADKVKRSLKKRNGICEDYALLFKSLCDVAGLESEVIKGYIRIDPTKLRSSGEKHVWNVIKIDGKWENIDATYGAGYLDDYNDYVFDYDDNYFLADKVPFSINHFPRDTSYQLIDTIMVRNQFKTLPIIGRGFFEFEIENFEPLSVIQEVKQGEDLFISFTSKKKISQFTIYKDKEEEYQVVKRLKEGDDYSVTIDSKDLRTGRIMLFGDRQLIAAYRVVVKR